MAAKYPNVLGVTFLRESPGGNAKSGLALVTLTLPAFTTATDSVQVGGTGTSDRGTATSDSLATIISKRRRDGKTVTLTPVAAGGGSTTAQAGKHGTVEFNLGTATISSGNLVYALGLTNAAGTGITAASGVTDRPITICVPYQLSDLA